MNPLSSTSTNATLNYEEQARPESSMADGIPRLVRTDDAATRRRRACGSPIVHVDPPGPALRRLQSGNVELQLAGKAREWEEWQALGSTGGVRLRPWWCRRHRNARTRETRCFREYMSE